jgi:hypothetical protein
MTPVAELYSEQRAYKRLTERVHGFIRRLQSQAVTEFKR